MPSSGTSQAEPDGVADDPGERMEQPDLDSVLAADAPTARHRMIGRTTVEMFVQVLDVAAGLLNHWP